MKINYVFRHRDDIICRRSAKSNILIPAMSSLETRIWSQFRDSDLKQAPRASFATAALKQAPRASFTLRTIYKTARSAILFFRIHAHRHALRAKSSVLETGSGSLFQGYGYNLRFYFEHWQKKKLTRLREANIYNNMLCIIKTSTQE
jgi:hypothetical protein